MTEEIQSIITGDPILHDAWRADGMAGVVRLQAKRLDLMRVDRDACLANESYAISQVGSLVEERDAARDFARKCWGFIQDGCFGDEAEADIGTDGSPERELYLKWRIVQFAVDDGRVPWLLEATE